MRTEEKKAAAMLKKIASGEIPIGTATVFTYKDPPPPKEEADAQFAELKSRLYRRMAKRRGAIY